MLNKVRQFIEQNELLSPDKRYIIALSGGADSVALLLVLQHLGYFLEAAHCNFHLRGEESNRDEQFVTSLCKRMKIRLHKAHFDTQSYADLHKVSIEMAARELRYHYFEQLRQDIPAEAICVAHHRNDNVETVLINLLRGTGIHGLVGIRPRNGHIVRPLLDIDRQEIETFLKQEGQPFVTDSSNLVDDVIRNKVRLNVIPLLKDIQPSVVENIHQTTRLLTEAEAAYNAYIKASSTKIITDNALTVNKLKKEPSPESILFEWLHPHGFSTATIRQISTQLDAPSGRMWTSASHELLANRGQLILECKQISLPSIRIPETGTYVYQAEQRFRFTVSDIISITRSANCACLDADKVSFPLVIRPVQEGDRFVPFGMTGSKLISDFLTDKKISLFGKRRQLVVVNANSDIVWLVGQRPDARYCVNSSTRSLLKIEHL